MLLRKISTAVLSGLVEIRHHILRSLLSLIGIVLGVMNLSAMFSVVEGARTLNQAMMNSIGSPDQVSLTLDWSKRKNALEKKYFTLGWEDIDHIRRQARTVKEIGVEIFTRHVCQFSRYSVEYSVLGVLPATFEMNRYDLARGRPLNAQDLEQGRKVCVIGTTVIKELFKDTDPLGQTMIIGGEYFKVVGILTEFGSFSQSGTARNQSNPMDWKNRRILIPATTLQNRFLGAGNTGNWFAISIQSREVAMVPETVEEVRRIMLATHQQQDLFRIQSMQEWQDQSEDFSRIWRLVLGFVAGISLAVGGVGIMNVMLASFRERMREIGIRKALGATRMDIFLLFVVETVLVCIIGGLLGLAAGYLVSTTALNAMLLETMPGGAKFSLSAGIWSVMFSLGVGLLAGLYPAFKAARLQPVDALRYE